MTSVKKLRSLSELWALIGTLNVVEVGSRGGPFCDLDAIASNIAYHGFEPDSDECDRLNAAACQGSRFAFEKYYSSALGSKNEILRLNLTSQRGCSSFFEPDFELLTAFGRSEWFKTERSVAMQVTPLDRLVSKMKLSRIDFLKLDVEGMELEILRGGENALNSLMGLRVEVNYMLHRNGQATFAELISYLHQRDFQIYQFLENHSWRPDSMMGDFYKAEGAVPYSLGQLAHGDVVLFRNINKKNTMKDYEPLAKLRLAALLFAYGYIAHAYQIIQTQPIKDFIQMQYGAIVEDTAFTKASRRFKWQSFVARMEGRAKILATSTKLSASNILGKAIK